jgi:hypothetical protein
MTTLTTTKAQTSMMAGMIRIPISLMPYEIPLIIGT